MKPLVFLAMLIAGQAFSQQAVLTWTAPTTHTDNTPIVLPITYQVEKQAGTSWDVLTTTSALTYTQTGLAVGEHCYRVRAVVNSAVSDPSNAACKTIPQPPPRPPVLTVVQVVADSNHSPVYLLTQSGSRDQRYKDACGYIPVGAACSGPVVYSFRGASFRRVSETDVKPWGASCAGFVVAPCS